MSTDAHEINVAGIAVQIIRKQIKNLHLGVYPPGGRVRVAVPLAVNDDAVRLAIISRLRWIKVQQAKFAAQPRQSEREVVSGESHYFLGMRYRLRVTRGEGRPHIVLRDRNALELHGGPGMTRYERDRLLQRWYRERLRELVPPLLEKWQAKLGVEAAHWGVKRMKTKWGSCNPRTQRIWLNLELVKKPVSCLEYIVVHELAHLIERHHNSRFVAILEQHMPTWRARRDVLNEAPLAHARWTY